MICLPEVSSGQFFQNEKLALEAKKAEADGAGWDSVYLVKGAVNPGSQLGLSRRTGGRLPHRRLAKCPRPAWNVK